MIGQTIPFYRNILEIARRSPANYGVEVECGELEWLLDWADAGIRAASAMSASGQDAEERLEAKPASAVANGETPDSSPEIPE